jgi:hypothetical protein
MCRGMNYKFDSGMKLMIYTWYKIKNLLKKILFKIIL